jgi:hypothetical protein
MAVRTLLLVLSTTTLSALAGCATTQTAPREDAASTSLRQGESEQKGCACALHKAQYGSIQAADAKGCGCPHCGGQAAGKAHAGEGASCGCSHKPKSEQTQAMDSER